MADYDFSSMMWTLQAIARFRCVTAPDRDKPSPATLVLVPPSNCDGRDMVNDKQWESFAKKHNLPMIACFFRDPKPDMVESYINMDLGGSDALDEASNCLGYMDHKFLMYGFSAGGEFNYEYNNIHPERVMAFVANKGGIYYSALCGEKARSNSGLMFIGSHDDPWRKTVLNGLFEVNRIAGCNWHKVVEECGHDEGDSIRISQEFFEDVLKVERGGNERL